jgi:GAF sensor signal transduction histidine kinase
MSSRSFAAATITPMIKMLRNLRLCSVLMLTVEGLNSSHVSKFLPAVILGVVSNSLLFSRRFYQKTPRYDTRLLVLLIVFDAMAILATATLGIIRILPLLIFCTGYILMSALLMGILLGIRTSLAWGAFAGVGFVICVSRIHYLSFDLAGLVVVGSFVMIILGQRLNAQMLNIENLASELVRANSFKAAAEERLVLARDIHDTVAKSAAGARMLAEVLHDGLAGTHYANDALTLFQALDELSRESRDVLHSLRSVPSQDLKERLSSDVRGWGHRTGIEVRVVCSGTQVSVDGNCAWQAQRVVGELLSNVEKHANADRVCATFLGTEEGLYVCIEDDGTGIVEESLQSTLQSTPPGHYGIQGMKERMLSMGGVIRISNGPNGGTIAQFSIPKSNRITIPSPQTTKSFVEGN